MALLLACLLAAMVGLLPTATAQSLSPCTNLVNGVSQTGNSFSDTVNNITITGCNNVVSGTNVVVTGNSNTVSGNTLTGARTGNNIKIKGNNNTCVPCQQRLAHAVCIWLTHAN
jgi:hypothetical protein